ncbi:MAG: HEPN domain-containing protein, partial [Oscillospiraceae bacterium]|nr:HEPN domain-containing protein [Oscillospiraceae bacterium]
MSMTVKQHTDSWSKSAYESMVSSRILLKNKRKIEALFFGHLAIEKILKAILAAKNLTIPKGRQGHDLVYLASIAKIQLTAI